MGGTTQHGRVRFRGEEERRFFRCNQAKFHKFNEYGSIPEVLGGCQPGMYAEVEVGVRKRRLLIDTGAQISVL